jgi:hypothetical protein
VSPKQSTTRIRVLWIPTLRLQKPNAGPSPGRAFIKGAALNHIHPSTYGTCSLHPFLSGNLWASRDIPALDEPRLHFAPWQPGSIRIAPGSTRGSEGLQHGKHAGRFSLRLCYRPDGYVNEL